MKTSEIIFFAVLIIIAVALIWVALVLRNDLKKCEEEENPLCPEYVCPSGNNDPQCGQYAFKMFQGKKICSGGKDGLD